jgi:hypothetical protein
VDAPREALEACLEELRDKVRADARARARGTPFDPPPHQHLNELPEPAPRSLPRAFAPDKRWIESHLRKAAGAARIELLEHFDWALYAPHGRTRVLVRVLDASVVVTRQVLTPHGYGPVAGASGAPQSLEAPMPRFRDFPRAFASAWEGLVATCRDDEARRVQRSLFGGNPAPHVALEPPALPSARRPRLRRKERRFTEQLESTAKLLFPNWARCPSPEGGLYLYRPDRRERLEVTLSKDALTRVLCVERQYLDAGGYQPVPNVRGQTERVELAFDRPEQVPETFHQACASLQLVRSPRPQREPRPPPPVTAPATAPAPAPAPAVTPALLEALHQALEARFPFHPLEWRGGTRWTAYPENRADGAIDISLTGEAALSLELRRTAEGVPPAVASSAVAGPEGLEAALTEALAALGPA